MVPDIPPTPTLQPEQFWMERDLDGKRPGQRVQHKNGATI